MNKTLKTVLQVLGIAVIIVAVIVFVRSKSARTMVGVDGEVSQTLTGSSSFFAPTDTPAPTTTPEPTFEETLGIDESVLNSYLDQIEWDDNFQELIDNDTETHDDPYYYQKLWLSLHPEYEIPGIGNIYYEDELKYSEEVGLGTPQPTVYINRTVEYAYDGGTITIGTDDAVSRDGIRLDMKCSAATDSGRVGFYLTAENTMLYMDWGPDDLKAADDFPGVLNFYIPIRYYNMLIPAAPTDILQGVYWFDLKADVGKRTDSDSIYARAINIDNGNILAAFKIDVAYVDGAYQITGVHDNEVSATNALSAEERSYILTNAVDYLLADDRGPMISVLEPDKLGTSAIVEKTPQTYFSTLYDAEQDPAIRSTYDGIDIYAVNVNVPGMGVVTLYYGPYTQVMYNFSSATSPGSDDKQLTLFGFDATAPFSKDTVMVINGFKP